MEAILEKILRREIPHCRALISAERLSGGASQETYRLEHERLQALLGAGGDLNELRWSLTNALRHGDTNLDQPGLAEHLRQTVVNQIAIDQPKYSGFKAATI
jgi:hypothetical protein